MSIAMQKAMTILAPAKINLYLHMTGMRADGYHLLDSLVVFADIGDKITIEPSPDFSFRVQGQYAGAFTAQEKDESPESSNILVRAVWDYAAILGQRPDCRVTLVKNLPLAAGIGGGSSDAASVLWGLSRYWNTAPENNAALLKLAENLGADVPVCMQTMSTRMSGMGEILEEAPPMADVPVVLVNPSVPCPTGPIFKAYDKKYPDMEKALVKLPEDLSDFDDFISFLRQQKNDLESPAVELVPVIGEVLECIQGRKNCALVRMSGSGATCFGLFKDEFDAIDAAEEISLARPAWWVRSGFINRVDRY